MCGSHTFGGTNPLQARPLVTRARPYWFKNMTTTLNYRIDPYDVAEFIYLANEKFKFTEQAPDWTSVVATDLLKVLAVITYDAKLNRVLSPDYNSGSIISVKDTWRILRGGRLARWCLKTQPEGSLITRVVERMSFGQQQQVDNYAHLISRK